ncbi:MAG: hypothetical protein LQ338_005285 [Usnochroma carphineum]|nr:MAG: hypothetical protein LQ338_005285 [Usnochroma carphineum]
MGQSASTQRDRPSTSRRDAIRRLSQRLQIGQSTVPDIRRPVDAPLSTPIGGQPQPTQLSERVQPIATFSRQISAQSIPARASLGQAGDTSAQDRIFYQQQEERPLVHMEELGMRNGPITHITASPMPRRHSTFSRVASRFVSRYASTGASESHQDPGVEVSLRRRLSERVSSRPVEDSSPSASRRFSVLNPLTRGPSLTHRPRRRREFAPISGPYPLVLDGSMQAPNFISTTSEHRDTAETHPAIDQARQSRLRHPSVQNSRLSRFRHSMSLPFETIRPLSRHFLAGNHGPTTPPERPPRSSIPGDPDYFLPPLDVTDTGLDMESSVLQSRIPEDGEQTTPQQASGTQQLSSDRWADRGSGSGREARRMPNMLRGRSSRLIRRQDEGPLPRILHLAAVAIAAQLSGNPDQAITNLQAVGVDGFDDSLNNLFRTLHEATDTMNSTPNANGPNDSATSLGSLPPLNFLRVFRFVNNGRDADADDNISTTPAQISGNISESPLPLDEDTPNATEGRTVTLVVVGVRSVPSDHIGQEDLATTGPSLEALLNMPLPAAAPPNLFRGSGSGSLLRRSDGRSRLPRPRRASVAGANPFPANQARQRQHRFNSSPSASGISTPATASSSVSGLADLPSGSHPPPSTPADYGLSPYASGTTTPSRRPSSASAMHQPPTSTRDMAYTATDDSPPTSNQPFTHPVHQRRRSDSEFARHRNLGAGAARRNGVVAPDGVEADNSIASGSRSWLIYVVGTNISENHPALTTPSLFTDNPTYEDMLLLSSLLGPARPPVASREDVASAPGVFRLRKSAGMLVAAALEGMQRIGVTVGERCLVCLCEYEVEEEVRQLNKCKHLFHRECIDQAGQPEDASSTAV